MVGFDCAIFVIFEMPKLEHRRMTRYGELKNRIELNFLYRKKRRKTIKWAIILVNDKCKNRNEKVEKNYNLL